MRAQEQHQQLAIPGNEDTFSVIKKVIANGDLSSLNDEGRVTYYRDVCKSMGLNPLTRPFEFITLKGKLTMYARRDCTDQLRKIYGVSCEKVEHKKEDGLYIVSVTVRDREGRADVSIGAIALGAQKGEELANLIMKAETKAKRRATLSLCGLGILDETEVETIREKNITPQPAKLEEYKIPDVKPEAQLLANAEQIATIKELAAKLKKDEGYLEKVLMAKFGQKNIESATGEFMQEWIEKLNRQLGGAK